jgi:REP element-mobilizing transposase RayT
MSKAPYRRRNLRLPTYDYTTPGSYFITVCVQQRACVLSDIVDGEVNLSVVGRMVEMHLSLVVDRYPDVELDTFVLMPNHLHAVFNIGWTTGENPERISLSRVMNWFKSATTNEYIRRVKAENWPRFPGTFWQINYHEHIVRDQADLDRIRQYIAGNPGKWELDTEYSPTCAGFPE